MPRQFIYNDKSWQINALYSHQLGNTVTVHNNQGLRKYKLKLAT